jgi:hypothetical protein
MLDAAVLAERWADREDVHGTATALGLPGDWDGRHTELPEPPAALEHILALTLGRPGLAGAYRAAYDSAVRDWLTREVTAAQLAD